jgi:DNA replication and repair protein RecF
MHIEKLSLLNFKNYEEANLSFSPGINVFVGKNGSGKTNLLDSIYYLSFTKSAFSPSDHHCIRTGENFFMIKAVFRQQSGSTEVVASVQSGSRKLLRENQVDYAKLSDHIGKYPAILIAPDDSDLIREGSELRRKFFDGIISQLDHKYLEDLLQYHHALKQRNALLKLSFESGRLDIVALETYDSLLKKFGGYIFTKRTEFIAEFSPVFHKYFSLIVEDKERPSLRYLSGLQEISFEEGLAGSRSRDQILQRTNFGIHKDDFEFLLKEGEIRKSGSQGQQKSFVIALKLAQFDIIEKYKEFKPLLLLDDIFDKLDDFRISALIGLIRTKFGQIFITDARPHRTSELLDNIGVPANKFMIEDGRIRDVTNA